MPTGSNATRQKSPAQRAGPHDSTCHGSAPFKDRFGLVITDNALKAMTAQASEM
jgi:hypothetical protein